MLNPGRYRQSGFTLVELMIAGTIGLFILGGAIALYGAVVRAGSVSLMEAQLSTELRGAMDLVTRDLRRAGYWAGEPDFDAITGNPFTAGQYDLTVDAVDGEPADSCITFAYDRDRDKHVGAGSRGTSGKNTDTDNVEQFGFRLHDGAVEARVSGSGPGCRQGRWQDVTNLTVEITSLRFAVHRNTINLSRPGSSCANSDYCQQGRLVEITLGGQLVNRPQTQRTLISMVQIRNDRLARIGR